MPDSEITAEVVRRNIPVPVAEKIGDITEQIRFNIPAELREPDFLDKVKQFLGHLLTEETTDQWAEAAAELVPWPGVGWLVKKTLDRLMPEKLLSLIYLAIDKITD